MSNNPPGQQVDQQQLMMYYQSIVDRIQRLVNTEIQVSNAIAELRVNLDTIIGLKNNPNDANVLLPLGGLLQIEANLTNSNKVLLDIGYGTFIPSTFDEAAETLNKRLGDMTQYLQRLVQEKEKLEAEANQLQSYFNQQ